MKRKTGTPSPRVLDLDELDGLLDELAANPKTYEQELEALVERLDAEDAELELRDPTTWRRDRGGMLRAAFPEQFRLDVEAIEPLDREAEARLARRVEFARLRLERACDAEDQERRDDASPMLPVPLDASPSPRVRRRALELHRQRVEMVERNLYLVLINAERYAVTGTNRADLIQEGCVSLFRAVDGFDWTRGLLFRTYAVHWLNQAFRNYLYNHAHTVRVPIYLQKALKHINQATIRLGDGAATPEQIAESSELNPKLVRSALAAARRNYSIDSPSGDFEGSRLADLLVDESAQVGYSPLLEDVSLEAGLERALDGLDEREAQVLKMRFGIGFDSEATLAEVAEHFGVSVERIRQIQVRALGKLDTPTLRRQLEPFLN